MKKIVVLATALVVSVLCGSVPAQERATAPETHVFATVDGVELKAYVFQPDPAHPKPRPAIVLFHGGGWILGEPAGTFPRARHYAELGMVAVAAQYRLSDQKKITPLEAMADARAVMRWVRANAAMLGIDPARVAAYGSSAGGHLAISAAIFDDAPSGGRAVPDALVLISPAVDPENDKWPQRLLGERAKVSTISPVAHVRAALPPTLILQGDVDTVTPLAGARLFCDRMRAAGNRCELHVYAGFGHLFTPAGTRDDGWPQPHPKIFADALEKADDFLVSLGYIQRP